MLAFSTRFGRAQDASSGTEWTCGEIRKYLRLITSFPKGYPSSASESASMSGVVSSNLCLFVGAKDSLNNGCLCHARFLRDRHIERVKERVESITESIHDEPRG
jgi:hypothetical protein